MSKIVYLIEQPLDERNYERFGIQTWIDRGWTVEVWDLTPVLYPHVWRNYFQMGCKLKEFKDYFPIASSIQLKCRYARPEKIEYFIDLAGDSFYAIRIKMRFLRMGAIRVVCAVGSIPVPSRSSLGGKIKKGLKSSPIKSFNWFIGVVLSKLSNALIKPGLVVASGSKSNYSMDRVGEIILAHNMDYDIYLKIKEAKTIELSDGGGGIFIDQDYCFHREFIYIDKPHPASPEKYFPAICNTLRNISDALGVPMCIASHPSSSHRSRDRDFFERIPVKYGVTAELIRDCSMVVCHDSTAVQFAVLFEKPLVFLTTDELNLSGIGASISVFASELGKSVINIDKDLDGVDWQKELSIDYKKYSEYKNKYIKIDGSPEKPYWDIVLDYMDKYKGGRLPAP